MRKIPTLFARDRATGKVDTTQVTPGCEWVIAGEGVATRKFDGTCTMLDADGGWWARREVKPGKTPPPGWRETDHDPVTGRRVGWEPIAQSPFARFHAEALTMPTVPPDLQPGTYELIGPKINSNPERMTDHRLVRHGCWIIAPPERIDPEHMVSGLSRNGWEGVVWWRDPNDPDCDKAKLKGRDFP